MSGKTLNECAPHMASMDLKTGNKLEGSPGGPGHAQAPSSLSQCRWGQGRRHWKARSQLCDGVGFWGPLPWDLYLVISLFKSRVSSRLRIENGTGAVEVEGGGERASGRDYFFFSS